MKTRIFYQAKIDDVVVKKNDSERKSLECYTTEKTGVIEDENEKNKKTIIVLLFSRTKSIDHLI